MSACNSILSVLSHAWISIQHAIELHELLALQCTVSQPNTVNHFPLEKCMWVLLCQRNCIDKALGKGCLLGHLTSMQINFMLLLNISGVWKFRTYVTSAFL